MIIAVELLGVLFLVASAALMWIAKPTGLQPAPFIARSYTVEIGYTLIVLALLTSGLACILWGLL